MLSNTSPYIDSDSACPEVWVAILHWKGADFTRSCLASLAGLKYPCTRVLLIDNGSPDSPGLALASEFPGVTCLDLKENLGFAGGFNAGIKYCLQQGAQWIWLLNNDTQVAPDSLNVLVSEALKNPRAAVLGAAVRCGGVVSSGPGQIDFLRAKTYLRPLNGAVQGAVQGTAAGAAQSALAHQTAITSQWLSGSNLLLRCDALTGDYVFDPNYFLYFEDAEFCTRIRSQGWECLFVPAACIYHEGNASTGGELSYWRAYYYTRNRLLFFSKALGFPRALPAFCSIALHLLRHFLVLPFRGSTGRKQLKAEYLGLRDYLQGHFGKAACLDWCSGRIDQGEDKNVG